VSHDRQSGEVTHAIFSASTVSFTRPVARLIKLFFEKWKLKFPKIVSYIGRNPGTIYSFDPMVLTEVVEPSLLALSSKENKRLPEG